MDRSNFHKFTSFSVHQAPLCKLDGAIVQFIKLPTVLIVTCDRIPDFTWSFTWSNLLVTWLFFSIGVRKTKRNPTLHQYVCFSALLLHTLPIRFVNQKNRLMNYFLWACAQNKVTSHTYSRVADLEVCCSGARRAAGVGHMWMKGKHGQ